MQHPGLLPRWCTAWEKTCFLRCDVTEITVLLQKDSVLGALCTHSDHINIHLLSPAHSPAWAFLEQWKMVVLLPKGTENNCAIVTIVLCVNTHTHTHTNCLSIVGIFHSGERGSREVPKLNRI